MSFISIDQAALPYSRELCFAGAVCDLRTNSFSLVAVLESLSLAINSGGMGQFRMRAIVDESSKEAVDTAHFRGMHHVVIASFGPSNVFIFDVLRRTLTASISAVVAMDRRFWKEKLIPISLGVLGAAMGLVPVHCACLEIEGDGLLIAGASGAGKSTLSVALSQGGFNYVSDDWTYITQRRGRMIAHGTSAPVKLLPDAVTHFQGLGRHSVQTSMNGELAYEVDIAETFDARVEHGCEPRWLVFLERTQRAGGKFAQLCSGEAKDYLNLSVESLPTQLVEAAERRSQIIESISTLPCWRFTYGGTPQFATQQLREFVVSLKREVFVCAQK